MARRNFGKLEAKATAWLIVMSPFIFLYSFCAGDSNSAKKPSDKIVSTTIGGVKVPGTMNDAKASGFTECREQSGTYVCAITKPILFEGVSIEKATLILNRNDNFSGSNYFSSIQGIGPDALTYRTITLALTKAKYDEKCLKKILKKTVQTKSAVDSKECIDGTGSYFFLEALKKNGWLERTEKARWTHFYKAGLDAHLTMGNNSNAYWDEVEIVPDLPKKNENEIASILEAQKRQQQKKSFDDQIISNMKSGK